MQHFFLFFVQNRIVVSILTVWFTALSAADLILCLWDKRCAKRGAWRVPEKRLLLIALFGGAPGLWAGMALFRHKTKHPIFQVSAPVLTVVQLGFLFFAALSPWIIN